MTHQLADILGISPPTLISKGRRQGVTMNTDFVQISLGHIRPWKGFNFANINAMYEDIFQSEIRLTTQQEREIHEVSAKVYTIVKEPQFREVNRRWLPKTVGVCLPGAINTLRERFDLDAVEREIADDVEMRNNRKTDPGVVAVKIGKGEKAGLKISAGGVIKVASKRQRSESFAKKSSSWLRTDWVVIDPELRELLNDENKGPGTPPQLIDVVGEEKRSEVFVPAFIPKLTDIGGVDFLNVADDEATECEHVIRCLKQLGTYAWLGKTRYAFILTPATMTFVRYFVVKKDVYSRYTVLGTEYGSIDYANSGVHVLTVNSAIFALAMMGQNDRHHEIVYEEDMEDIDIWYYDDVEEERFYFHPLSEIIRPDQPPVEAELLLPVSSAKLHISRRFTARISAYIEEVKDHAPFIRTATGAQKRKSSGHEIVLVDRSIKRVKEEVG